MNHTSSATIKSGSFCWVEAASTDIAASKAFYGKLFGWSFHEDGEGEMSYTHLRWKNLDIGGLYALMPEHRRNRDARLGSSFSARIAVPL